MSVHLAMMKTAAEKIPPGLGPWLAAVPFSLRLGPAYSRARRDLRNVLQMGPGELREEVCARIAALLPVARKSPFWRERLPERLPDFDAVAALPLTTKDDLRAVAIEQRSVQTSGCLRINTGGTSGSPLSFYIDRQAFAREWAHMHYIWQKAGYLQTDIKLTLRGRIPDDQPLRYNAVHNEYVLHPSLPADRLASAVEKIASRIRFIHGYPSLIYSFLKYCDECRPEVIGRLRKSLKGVLLGSELPAPVYRNFIDDVTGVPSVSWYGHSEMALLALEQERGIYVPLQSYGYAEAVPASTAGEYRLVGTSYFNTASPFIRYDTGDLVDAQVEEGLLKSFRITSGRVGDFVQDRHGCAISLTALVFGRHHALFDRAAHVQIRQAAPGCVELVVTPGPGQRMTPEDVLAAFDSSAVDMEFRALVVDSPVRAPSGKIPLLIREWQT